MIGTGIAMLIAGLAAGAGQVTAAKIASNSAKRGGALDAAGADKQLAFAKDEAIRDQANFDKTQALNYEQWANHERMLAPYRSIGANATTTLGNMIGLPVNTAAFEPPPYAGSGQPPASAATPGSGDATVPQRPKDLTTAIQSANDLAYGYAKHKDDGYWTNLWAKDPDYAWKRMLGWQAGAQDAPSKGPYAGQATAGAAGNARTTPTTLNSLMASQIAMPSAPSVARPAPLAVPPPQAMTLSNFIQPPRAYA